MSNLKKYALMALKKKAPKVPNYTCTDIDNVITTLEHIHTGTKKLTKLRLDVLERKLERLRASNEGLRDSGIYWYGITKKIIKNLKDNGKKANLSKRNKKNRKNRNYDSD
jgi:hypothetical protein|tara:strand:- start:602 stop:931 length:330 start_codon:yes stop_codon:yes gene_type:complete